MANGHVKGMDFENDICRAISRWVVPTTPENAKVADLPFRRRFTASTPLDGHWTGDGDVLHKPDIEFPFCIECKKVEGWELDGLFQADKCPIWKWWEQAREQADRAGTWPLLIFARNRVAPYILIEESVSLCLRLSPINGPVAQLRLQPPASGHLVLALLTDLLAVPVERLSRLLPMLATSRKTRPARP